MSDNQPSLDDYPGYFPAAKPPFWTRTKTGVATGMAGLVLGVAMGGTSSTDAADAAAGFTQADLDAAVATATDDLRGQVDDAQAAVSDGDGLAAKLESARQQLKDQRAQAAATLRKVKREARSAQRATVATAVATAEAEAAPPQPLANTGGGTDPHFSYCYEAIDAGYGPYVEGEDPEYDWYDDADGDGIVCES